MRLLRRSRQRASTPHETSVGVTVPPDDLTPTDEQLDRIADRIAVRLAFAKPAAAGLLTVEDVSTTFKVSRAWVYENAGRLGGVKLGPGERAPLRFDRERVARALRPVGELEPQGQAEPQSDVRPAKRGHRQPYLHPVYDG
jgi:hypothetical protein